MPYNPAKKLPRHVDGETPLLKFTAVVAVAFSLVTLSEASAQSQAARPGMVEWMLPAVAPSKPQNDAEKERGMTAGRDLPALELLQPTLDPGLPEYRPRRDLALRGQFKAAASDVLAGLSKAWVAAFEAYYPGVRIRIDPPYAGSLGAKELVKGKLDFVFVSRELKPDDITDFHAAFGYDPLSVPVSGGSYRHFGFLDAVGFIVNKDNPIEQLSFDQLDALFSTTRWHGGAAVKTWGDLGLGGEWADKPVRLYGVKPWNGFEEFIRQRVLSTNGHRGEWRDDIAFSPTVFALAGNVARDKYGIAYDGIAYLDAPVKVLALGPTAAGPFVAPSYENVAAATYPLSRLIYFNVNRAPGKPLDPVVTEFLRFVLSREGQAIVQKQNVFVPLRASQVHSSRTLLSP
jgi:phosphate transport system substrate-binding protein